MPVAAAQNGDPQVYDLREARADPPPLPSLRAPARRPPDDLEAREATASFVALLDLRPAGSQPADVSEGQVNRPCHHSNPRRFRCACGRVNEWKYYYDLVWLSCACGWLHMRTFRGPRSTRKPRGCDGCEVKDNKIRSFAVAAAERMRRV